MGMSASQARLLSITSRMNDVEFKSQQIANTKIRLADDSERVARDYNTALSKQKLTFTTFANNSIQKIDLTLARLCEKGSSLRLKTRDGKLVVSSNSDYAKAYNSAISGYNKHQISPDNANIGNSANIYALMMKFGVSSFDEACAQCGVTRDVGNHWKPLIEGGYITQDEVKFLTGEFNTLFNLSSGDGAGNKQKDGIVIISGSYLSDPNWLYEAIESGEFMLEKGAPTLGWEETTVSTTVSISQETDNSGFAKAEAEYNAETAKIKKKEQILDNELKALDTEHQALKTEMDSVKSLIKDNVDKSFNLFS